MSTRHGGPVAYDRPIADAFDADEFWADVDKRNLDECWEYDGYRRPDLGYGLLQYKDDSIIHAHRVAYALAREEPGDMLVLHKCDNPPCVNPWHLYTGTPSDNMKDKWARSGISYDGEKNPNAKLSKEDVEDIRERLAAGEQQDSIAEDYGVIRQTIGHINTGERWPEPNGGDHT